MRKATIDGCRVLCRKGSFHHYGAYAHVGDWLTYDESNGSESNGLLRVGRMIGRIKHAPAFGVGTDSTPAIDNWLLVLALSNDATSLYIRWVNPDNVTRVESPNDGITRLAAMFFAVKLPFNRDELMFLSDYGTLQAQFYSDDHSREVIAKQNDQRDAFNKAHPELPAMKRI